MFKLRSPDNAIVGGGFFERYSELPISLAWQAFGEKNGASSLAEIRERTARLRKHHPRPWEDYTIGCILLAEPFLWEERDWIPQPEDWAPSTQRGKGYDLRAEIGRTLWTQVFDRLRGTIVSEPKPGSGSVFSRSRSSERRSSKAVRHLRCKHGRRVCRCRACRDAPRRPGPCRRVELGRGCGGSVAHRSPRRAAVWNSGHFVCYRNPPFPLLPIESGASVARKGGRVVL